MGISEQSEKDLAWSLQNWPRNNNVGKTFGFTRKSQKLLMITKTSIIVVLSSSPFFANILLFVISLIDTQAYPTQTQIYSIPSSSLIGKLE